jgi:preprotein translocase subunit SecG
METVLLVIHIMVVLALVAVVLLQKSEGGALGMGGGGGGGGFFSSRGTANLLTRTTAILAAVFFVTSITLTFISGRTAGTDSLLERVLGTEPLPAGGAPAPGADGTRGSGQGILDTLRPPSDTPADPGAVPAPATPAPPSGPQVPSGD